MNPSTRLRDPTAESSPTRRYRKPTNTKVAPIALMQQIAAEAQLAVIALSD